MPRKIIKSSFYAGPGPGDLRAASQLTQPTLNKRNGKCARKLLKGRSRSYRSRANRRGGGESVQKVLSLIQDAAAPRWKEQRCLLEEGDSLSTVPVGESLRMIKLRKMIAIEKSPEKIPEGLASVTVRGGMVGGKECRNHGKKNARRWGGGP